MMTNYLKLQSLDDLTEMLWADGPTALMIAGGTDVLVQPAPFEDKQIVIDIGDVAELKGIGPDEEGFLRIGAAVTHQEIADDPLVRRKARLLGLACAAVGSVQIRNRGTLGGNLGNASPAADSVPALVCLEAEVILAGRDKRRTLPVLSFSKGPGKTDRGFDEVIEAVRLPVRKGRQVAFFKKAGQRKGMCCSKASVALCARRHTDGRLTDVRVAMGAVGPTVLPVPKAQEALEGRKLDAPAIRHAARACMEEARAIDDIRSTARYRSRVVGALLTGGLLETADHMRALARRRARRKRRRR